jgi:NTP pyrophosphatase (non-canonical NTP hydrolase)
MTRDEEIMTILQEECAEVIQMVSKIKRFGLDEIHLKQGGTNRERLTEEVGDLQAMINLLQLYNVVDVSAVEEAKNAKFEKLKYWSKIYE